MWYVAYIRASSPRHRTHSASAAPGQYQAERTTRPAWGRGWLVSRVRDSMTKARDAVEDFVRRLGPNEGLGGRVRDGDVAPDGLLQLPRAAVYASSDLFFRERGKPPLHEIDPRGAGGREVQMEARMAGQPPMDGRRVVGAGVVQDQVDVQARGHASVDGREELPKLSGALTLLEFADHFAALRIQGATQRRGAVSRVILRA